MAETLKLPKETINSEWRDDVDVDYAIYGNSEKSERTYISPEKVSEEGEARIESIKKRNIKLGRAAVFFSKDKFVA